MDRLGSRIPRLLLVHQPLLDILRHPAVAVLAVSELLAAAAMPLLRGREKGPSPNSTSLAPKPLASSVKVPVTEATSPCKQSISVMSRFPSITVSSRDGSPQ